MASPFVWNVSIPRWLGFGVFGRLAWARKDTRWVEGEGKGYGWWQVVWRLHVSDRRPWDQMSRMLEQNPEMFSQ